MVLPPTGLPELRVRFVASGRQAERRFAEMAGFDTFSELRRLSRDVSPRIRCAGDCSRISVIETTCWERNDTYATRPRVAQTIPRQLNFPRRPNHGSSSVQSSHLSEDQCRR